VAIAVDIGAAAALLGGITRTEFGEMVERVEMPPARVLSGRRVWLADELVAAARGLPLAPADASRIDEWIAEPAAQAFPGS